MLTKDWSRKHNAMVITFINDMAEHALKNNGNIKYITILTKNIFHGFLLSVYTQDRMI